MRRFRPGRASTRTPCTSGATSTTASSTWPKPSRASPPRRDAPRWSWPTNGRPREPGWTRSSSGRPAWSSWTRPSTRLPRCSPRTWWTGPTSCIGLSKVRTPPTPGKDADLAPGPSRAFRVRAHGRGWGGVDEAICARPTDRAMLSNAMNESRGVLGAAYRITADFLEKRGLKSEVSAKLSPASRKFVDKPPFAFSWHDYAALEEIEKVLHARSPELAADLGFAAAEHLTGTVVAPVMKMALTLFGKSPDQLFANLDRFYSMVTRGFSFRYERAGEKAGQVRVTISGGKAHESLFQQIKGNLRIIYAFSGANGTVDEPAGRRSDDAGGELALRVSWACPAANLTSCDGLG